MAEEKAPSPPQKIKSPKPDHRKPLPLSEGDVFKKDRPSPKPSKPSDSPTQSTGPRKE